ncbi:MAG: hypothetical protein IT443_02630 [Phycisphaeraceae bacterium]|nr:hypothetical protein [Phycisphaeraceae bacterium]
MKKNLGLLQSLVEKVVLGLAILVALTMIWLYSLANPYTVEVRVGRAAEQSTPSQVVGLVTRAADGLSAKVASDQVPQELSSFEVADYAQDIKTKLERSVTGGIDRFQVPFGLVGLARGQFQVGAEPEAKYDLPTPPAPTDPQARPSHGVLAETGLNPNDMAKVVAIIGDEQPRDFRYVSVGAQFDMKAWSDLLQQQTADGRQLPTSWQRNATYVVDVLIERQELDPLTGQWGPTVLVDVLPGQMSFRHLTVASRAEANVVITAVRGNQELLARPPFLPLAGGPPWRSPDAPASVLTIEQHDRLALLNKEIDRLNRQIDSQAKRVESADASSSRRGSGAAAPPPTAAPPPQMQDPNLTSGLGGGGGPGSGQRRTPSGPPRRMTPQEQLEDLRRQVQEKTQELNDLLLSARQGVEVGSSAGRVNQPAGISSSALPPGVTLPPDFFTSPGASSADSSSAADSKAEKVDTIKCWAHDIAVAPGKTYRYRLILGLLNPLYQRQQNLTAEQKPLAEQLVLRSQPSAWTDPVHVEPQTQFFVVAGSAPQQTAIIEAYHLYDGVWRSCTFEGVHPGDAIGGTQTKSIRDQKIDLTFDLGLVLIDLIDNEAGSVSDTQALFLNVPTDAILARSVRSDNSDPQRVVFKNDELLWDYSPSNQQTPGGQPPGAPPVGPPSDTPSSPDQFAPPTGYQIPRM